MPNANSNPDRLYRREFVETPKGWSELYTGRMYSSAVLAQKSSLRRDADEAKANDCNVTTIITWDPTTAIGRAAVEAITA